MCLLWKTSIEKICNKCCLLEKCAKLPKYGLTHLAARRGLWMIAHLGTPGPSSIGVTRQRNQLFCICLSILLYIFSRLCTYLFVNCVCGYLWMIAHLGTPGPSTSPRGKSHQAKEPAFLYLFYRFYICVNVWMMAHHGTAGPSPIGVNRQQNLLCLYLFFNYFYIWFWNHYQ